MKMRTLLLTGLIFALLLAGCSRSTPTPVPTPTAAEAATEAAAPAEPTAAPEGDTADAAPTEAAVEEPAGEEAAAEEPAAAQATPAQTAVITVGVNAQFEPFVYLDQNGSLAGFDIDIMNALNAVMDFEVAYQNTTFEDLFTGLENGELDAAISAISVTDARKERVDFTDPYFASGLSPVSYFSAGQALATRTDNTTITGAAGLTADVKVGVKQGTTGEDYAVANTEADVVLFDESTPLLQALVNGEVDAIILDTPVIIRFIKANPGVPQADRRPHHRRGLRDCGEQGAAAGVGRAQRRLAEDSRRWHLRCHLHQMVWRTVNGPCSINPHDHAGSGVAAPPARDPLAYTFTLGIDGVGRLQPLAPGGDSCARCAVVGRSVLSVHGQRRL
ncbi:MAG: transporter substrate-binding domain-containing protein [Caldilineaceae bacterium]